MIPENLAIGSASDGAASEENSTMECDKGEIIVDVETLTLLMNIWNTCSQSFDANDGNNQRGLYLKDMISIRRRPNHSLSSSHDNNVFTNSFNRMDEANQDLFLACAKICFEKGRHMSQPDLQKAVEEIANGKRTKEDFFKPAESLRPGKRPRNTYFWLAGIHDFE